MALGGEIVAALPKSVPKEDGALLWQDYFNAQKKCMYC